MRLRHQFTERLGPLLGMCGLAFGLAVGGPKPIVLSTLVGFFLGMSLRSVARTLTVDAAAQ